MCNDRASDSGDALNKDIGKYLTPWRVSWDRWSRSLAEQMTGAA
jgi:hypothetical protein